jgi:branched-chain amino acid aminotransferase
VEREAVSNYYIFNGKQYATDHLEIFDKIDTRMIYEVIRIMDKVPLFLEEHLERMRKSADLLGYSITKSNAEITKEILTLIESNRCHNINVKLLCSHLDKKEQDFLTYFIRSYYPERDIYEKGIHTVLYRLERTNPNVKEVHIDFKQTIAEVKQNTKAFEVLLVNKNGYITEGSRSNLFFVKGDTVYTASSQDVLVGVTRTHIMKICSSFNIPVVEGAIHIEDLAKFDGAFITGTSINALPITTIDEKKLDSIHHPIICKIMKEYEEEVEQYIDSRKKKGTVK